MWADYYEKYRGTPKFGLSEQDKLEAQAKLEGLKNAYMLNALNLKLGEKGQEAGNKTGSTYNSATNTFTPITDTTKIAPAVAAGITKNTTQADVNKNRAEQLATATGVLKDALGTPTNPAGQVGATNQTGQPGQLGTTGSEGTPELEELTSQSGLKIKQPKSPKMVISGVRAGGVTAVNPAWQADKAVIGQEAKNFGVQTTKTNAALHGMALFDSVYDPKTDAYDLSKLPAEELSNVTSTVISSSQKGDAKTREEMRMRSLQGDVAGGISWLYGVPLNQVPKPVAQQMLDILSRQGETSGMLKRISAESMGAQNVGADFATEAEKLPAYQDYKKRKAAKEKMGSLTAATKNATDPYAAKRQAILQRYPDLAASASEG